MVVARPPRSALTACRPLPIAHRTALRRSLVPPRQFRKPERRPSLPSPRSLPAIHKSVSGLVPPSPPREGGLGRRGLPAARRPFPPAHLAEAADYYPQHFGEGLHFIGVGATMGVRTDSR